MDALDMLCLCTEIPGEGQEIPCVATGGDAPPDAPCCSRGQRCRQVEPPRSEIEFRVKGQEGTRGTTFPVELLPL